MDLARQTRGLEKGTLAHGPTCPVPNHHKANSSVKGRIDRAVQRFLVIPLYFIECFTFPFLVTVRSIGTNSTATKYSFTFNNSSYIYIYLYTFIYLLIFISSAKKGK